MPDNPFASDRVSAASRQASRPVQGRCFVRGPDEPRLGFETVGDLLDQVCGRSGAQDAVCVAATGERLSWYDLRCRADALAAGLLALGIRSGERVGVCMGSKPEALLAQMATARIGAVWVGFDPAVGLHDIEAGLHRTGVRVLLMARHRGGADATASLRDFAPEIERAVAGERLRIQRLPKLRHVVIAGAGSAALASGLLSFEQVCALGGPAQAVRLASMGAAVDPDDPAMILFTRGQDGEPAAATLSHAAVTDSARCVASALALSAPDRVCIPVPLHRAFGAITGVLGCVASGAAMVLPGEFLDAAATLDAVERERCTVLHGTPAVMEALLDHSSLGKRDLTRLRTGVLAGGPSSPDLLAAVTGRLHLSGILAGYGLTEASHLVFWRTPAELSGSGASSVGRIRPHLAAKVVDRQGRMVPPGTRGELRLRGPALMRWYWGDPKRTQEAFDAAGWLRTGDFATIDEGGWCRIQTPDGAVP